MALGATDIDILVQRGEGTTLEFKESLSASFARELVALAFVTVTFRPNPEVRQAAGGELGRTPQVAPEVAPQVTPQVTPQVAPEVVTDQVTDTDQVTPQLAVLQAIFGEMSRQQLQESLGLKHAGHFREAYLEPTLQAGSIEMTIPEKPRSSKQKYRLTAAGRCALQRVAKGRHEP